MIAPRGRIDDRIPTDPTMYRFYEMLQVYGTTLKALVHEKFGDGIISAINFKLDVKKWRTGRWRTCGHYLRW